MYKLIFGKDCDVTHYGVWYGTILTGAVHLRLTDVHTDMLFG